MSVERIDKYTISVDGYEVRADESQEARIRAMSEDERSRFVAIMGRQPMSATGPTTPGDRCPDCGEYNNQCYCASAAERGGESGCAPSPECRCRCHMPGGMTVSHVVPCCRPAPLAEPDTGEPVQTQGGNQISQPTRLGEQGERDGKNSGVHRDRTRQPEDGSDRSGLPGGSGVLDRAGLDPSRGVVEGDPGRLTQEPRAGSARPEATPPVQTQETLAGLLAKHRWNAELLYFAAESWIACGCGERVDVPIAVNEANAGDVWAAYHVHVEAAVLLAGWVSPADHARALTEAWDQGWASGTMYGYDEQRYPNPFRKGDADD